MTSPTQPVTHLADGMTDAAARAADAPIQRANRSSRQGLDTLADSVQSAREQVGPALLGLATDAQGMARDGAKAIGQRAQQVRDTSEDWIRERPLQAMLIAAGTGAALALLAGWLSRFNGRSR